MEKIIKNLLEASLAGIDIKIESITYQQEGMVNILRITIDKEPHVDVEDCVTVTKIINPIIDKANLIDDEYILDVCSKTKGGKDNGQ